MYPDTDEIRKRVEQRMRKRADFAIHAIMFIILNVLAWLAWWPYASWAFPWPLIVSLLWGSGVLAHGIETRYESGGQSAAQERAIRSEMTQLYGDDWPSDASESDYHHVRADVEKRFKARMDFVVHAAMYVPFNALAWVIWFGLSHGEGSPWLPIAFSSLWGVGLAAHAVETFFTARQSVRETAIREEMEREWRHIHGEDKLKHKAKNDERLDKAQRLQLTSDGELLDIVDDDFQANKKGS